jgi:hypothetical protein
LSVFPRLRNQNRLGFDPRRGNVSIELGPFFQ